MVLTLFSVTGRVLAMRKPVFITIRLDKAAAYVISTVVVAFAFMPAN